MSGLVKTTPLPAVIRRIEQHGGIVVDKKGGSIDMPAGVDAAIRHGYKKIAVTVAGPGSAEAIRMKYPEAIIMAVHVSGLTYEETERLVAVSDLITSCASKPVREIAGRRALVQAGTAIPVFAVTKKGKQLITEKMARSDEPFVIKTTKLPVTGESEPKPLV
jgi:putative methanogenesis marker protein 8